MLQSMTDVYTATRKRDEALTIKALKERKVLPNKNSDNAQTDIFKRWLKLRVGWISECTFEGILSLFREVLFGHQLLLWIVGTVYSHQIYRRKAWESYRQEERGFLLGGGRRDEVGNSFKYGENGEKTHNSFSLRCLHTGMLPFKRELQAEWRVTGGY